MKADYVSNNNQYIFDFMKVNKPMEKNLIMEHNYLEILQGVLGDWGNCIKDPREGEHILGCCCVTKLTLSVVVFTAIITTKY